MVSWLRRGHDSPAASAPDGAAVVDGDAGDSPEALRTSVAALVAFVNRSAGELPVAAVVRTRRLTDTLSEVIDTSAVRPLDVYALISLRGTLDDYLPTTLRGYLAVAADLREQVRASGRTATQSLLEQLDALQTSASSVLVAARDQDVDALMTQGSFLRTKFSGSDLDL